MNLILCPPPEKHKRRFPVRRVDSGNAASFIIRRYTVLCHGYFRSRRDIRIASGEKRNCLYCRISRIRLHKRRCVFERYPTRQVFKNYFFAACFTPRLFFGRCYICFYSTNARPQLFYRFFI